MNTVTIQDAGPVERLEIPIPAEGGVVVLRGRNGSGKTIACQAVSALIGVGDPPPSRDGSLGVQVEGLGARLTVGRRANYSGEVEVAHLEGEDPSLLVDPGLKSEEAADAARLRALLRLSRATVNAGAFAELVGGMERLQAICRPQTLEMRGDVPALAAAMKRDFEAGARRSEGVAENASHKVSGIERTLEGLGDDPGRKFTTPSSGEARAAHTAAVREHSALEATRAQNTRLLQSAAEARVTLESLGDEGTPAAIEAANKHANAVGDARQRLEVELARTIEKMEAEIAAKLVEEKQAARAVHQQQRVKEQRGSLGRVVDSATGAYEVNDSELERLGQRVEAARAEVEAWTIRERTERVRAEVEELRALVESAGAEAQLLRSAAQGTEAIVLEAVRNVCGDDMEILDGRLYVTSERGKELFSELSQGERWRKALDIAVAAVGRSGLLVVRQEAYEALDPVNRREVAEHARKIGVVILTAEADEGDIRAEVVSA